MQSAPPPHELRRGVEDQVIEGPVGNRSSTRCFRAHGSAGVVSTSGEITHEAAPGGGESVEGAVAGAGGRTAGVAGRTPPAVTPGGGGTWITPAGGARPDRVGGGGGAAAAPP